MLLQNFNRLDPSSTYMTLYDIIKSITYVLFKAVEINN